MRAEDILEIEDRWRKGESTGADVRMLLNELSKIKDIEAEPFVAGGELRGLAGRTVYIRPETQDETAYREVAIGNEYELPDSFDPTDIVIDVGANIGAFTLACIARGCKSVYAFEPDPENFKVLMENTKDLKNVFCHQFAVWREGEPVKLVRRNPKETAMSWTNPGVSGVPIQSISMDKILSKFKTVRLLKIDAEGAEWPIFFASENLGRAEEIVCEVHLDMKHSGYPCDLASVCSKLQKAGFSCKITKHPDSPEYLAYLRATK